MKCPKCKYQNGWDWDDEDQYQETTGKHGTFYQLPIKMERTEFFDTNTKKVFACPNPNCRTLFIEE